MMQTFKNRLIKLLGGYTLDEVAFLTRPQITKHYAGNVTINGYNQSLCHFQVDGDLNINGYNVYCHSATLKDLYINEEASGIRLDTLYIQGKVLSPHSGDNRS